MKKLRIRSYATKPGYGWGWALYHEDMPSLCLVYVSLCAAYRAASELYRKGSAF